MKKTISNQTFDEERALYNLENYSIINCNFAGAKDGESVLKECRKIDIENCSFSLRYPIWHAKKFVLKNSKMDDKTRAPLWYSNDGVIESSKVEGIKCLRECKNILIQNSIINSDEFGWRCKKLKIENSEINSVYFLFESKDVEIDNLKINGKYSFQYMKNLHIENSNLDTKDAFWHSKNIVVENSFVKGEYLGWFSENLTFINCTIEGTQPLCYAKNLKLINCKMINCDLAFEYSDVNADIKGKIDSVKNPKSGIITADIIGEIINEKPVIKCGCKIEINNPALV